MQHQCHLRSFAYLINLDFSFVDNHSPASLILDVTHRAFDFNKIPNVDAVEVSRELSTLGKPRIIVREVYFDDELDRISNVPLRMKVCMRA